MYKLTPSGSIIRIADGACIPLPPNESEGWAYQAWLDAGNVPEPAGLGPAPKDVMWEKIKVERDRRKGAGVKVDQKWFHTDADSRIQQLGLVLFGSSVPPVQWKTLDGSKVSMTQSLANQIFQAVAGLDQVLFAKAEEHRAAMEASTDPSSYDFSVGWPLAYGE
jgi:hypothetical protein